ncbi:MAG: septum formation initiator family protein [Lachnospiraceae bacterium]|nr:septum formation initiator family protein [Lachnospiraceae bacterium]
MARKAVNHQNRKAMLYISGILLIMLTVLAILSFRLYSQRKALLSEIEIQETRKQEELARAAEIENFAGSTNTREFIEQMAKEKLGLLYSNEIVFKKE